MDEIVRPIPREDVCEACWETVTNQKHQFNTVLEVSRAMIGGCIAKLRHHSPLQADHLESEMKREAKYIGTSDLFAPFHESKELKMNATINVLQDRVEQLEKELASANNRCNATDRALKREERKKCPTQHKIDMQEMQSRISKLATDKFALEKQLKTATADLQKIEDTGCKHCIGKMSDIHAAETKVKNFSNQCKEKDNQILDLKKENQKLKEEAKKKGKSVGLVCKECDTNAEKIKSLKGKIKKSDEEYSKLKSDFILCVSSSAPLLGLMARFQGGKIVVYFYEEEQRPFPILTFAQHLCLLQFPFRTWPFDVFSKTNGPRCQTPRLHCWVLCASPGRAPRF